MAIEDYFDEPFTVRRPTEGSKDVNGNKVITNPIVASFLGKRESQSGNLETMNEKETVTITDIIFGPLGHDIKVGDDVFDTDNNKFRVHFNEKIIKASHIELRTEYIK